MNVVRRAVLPGMCVALLWSVSPAAGQDSVAPVAPALTPDDMEEFLLNGEILESRELAQGLTNSRRATLSYRGLTHDVHIQTVDIFRARYETLRGTEVNFRDSYRYNIAAYRLARLLRLDNVPMSVERPIEGRPAAVTWWIDDVAMDEGERRENDLWGDDRSRTAGQIHVRRVFDELIFNTDRNVGNTLWSSDWKMWLIDHTRAFRQNQYLGAPELLERCEVRLGAHLRALTFDSVAKAVGNSLTRFEIETLLMRRDKIVALFDELIAERGVASVFYSLTTG